MKAIEYIACLVLIAGAADACKPSIPAAQPDPGATRPQLAESPQVETVRDSTARKLFGDFLNLSTEAAAADSVAYKQVISDNDACWEPTDVFRSYWLADYRILSVRAAGDSARATAEIVSAATQVPDSKGDAYASVVTQGVRRDTVEFLLVRESAGWRVCGRAANGWDFGGYGTPANVRYAVPGTSRQTVLALVDSIRRRSHRR